jgi:hypothetical protein
MGEAFVAGWIRLASGEKDPRNLIVAFAIYRVVLIEFPITKHLDVCRFISSRLLCSNIDKGPF